MDSDDGYSAAANVGDTRSSDAESVLGGVEAQ